MPDANADLIRFSAREDTDTARRLADRMSTVGGAAGARRRAWRAGAVVMVVEVVVVVVVVVVLLALPAVASAPALLGGVLH
jgi:t-SNARE complex subunit (syntaxin)